MMKFVQKDNDGLCCVKETLSTVFVLSRKFNSSLSSSVNSILQTAFIAITLMQILDD